MLSWICANVPTYFQFQIAAYFCQHVRFKEHDAHKDGETFSTSKFVFGLIPTIGYWLLIIDTVPSKKFEFSKDLSKICVHPEGNSVFLEK